MAFSGGVYTLPTPALVPGQTVSSSENNTVRNDMAASFNLTWLRNGTAAATANIPMGSFKLTGLGAATTSGDALSYGNAAVVTTLTSTTLTATRVPYAGTGGLLQDASTFTFDGTTLTAGGFSTAGSITVSGGTANGVAYLNGSKVLTTGSALTFDGSNLGLGVTPSAWGGSFKAIELAGGSLNGTSTNIGISQNAYRGASSWTYATSAAASLYQTSAGSHFWYNAPSGTAGNAITFTQAMTLDASGRLGVGITNPSLKLQVVGVAPQARFSSDTSTSGALDLHADSSECRINANYYNTAVPLTFYTGSAERMRIDSSGNVGIGDTTSAAKLYVSASGAGNQIVQMWKSASGNSSGLKLISNASTEDYLLVNNYANALAFGTNNTERMRIDSSGNVGIGATTTYNLKAQIVGTATTDSNGGGTGAESILGLTDTTAYAAGVGGGIAFSGYYDATPNRATFGVVRGIKENATSGNYAGALTFLNRANGGNLTERMRIDSSGNWMLGKTTTAIATVGVSALPGGRVMVGNAASTGADDGFQIYSTGASAYRFYVSMAGTVYATNTTISAISDQRLKENVRDLDVGLDAVMALKPRKFDWKAGKGKDIKNDRGFIAQEFEQVFPDLIDEWKDPAPEGEEPYKSVRQDLIPVLVRAIQELKAELDATKAEVAALKGN